MFIVRVESEQASQCPSSLTATREMDKGSEEISFADNHWKKTKSGKNESCWIRFPYNQPNRSKQRMGDPGWVITLAKIAHHLSDAVAT